MIYIKPKYYHFSFLVLLDLDLTLKGHDLLTYLSNGV